MPIENISFSQKQERLFGEKLSIQRELPINFAYLDPLLVASFL